MQDIFKPDFKDLLVSDFEKYTSVTIFTYIVINYSRFLIYKTDFKDKLINK